MMYQFVDTTETQTAENILPEEALCFNGVWLDHEVAGFRTLNVSGRESIQSDISDAEIASRDGNLYQYARYLPRTITVKFQLIAKDSAQYRESFNRLNLLLSERQARIIFADEMDKYYVGTMTDIGEIEAGKNATTGEITLYCADPIKYAVTETVVPSDDAGEVDIYYKGTYPAYPVLSAEMVSDNGFLGFLHEVESSDTDDIVHSDGEISIGNPEEADGTTYAKSETLISEIDLDDWTQNTVEPILSSAYTVTGEAGMIGYTKYSDISSSGGTASKSTALGAKEYGEGSGWHGPSVTLEIPEDSNGYVGASSFTLTVQNYFLSLDTAQLGAFQLLVFGVSNDERVNICGATFWRNNAASSKIGGFWTAEGNSVQSFSFENSRTNAYTGWDSSSVKLEKYGETLTFAVGDKTYTTEIAELADIEATEISIFFGQWGTADAMLNVVESLKFVKALFQELLTFIVETDTDNVTGLTLASAVTYNGVKYTTDSREYRLAKYKYEAADHMAMDSILFQHLITLAYTLPDNRAKNMFWGYSKSTQKWHLCFAYDMDTAMGNDNEGGLTLKAGYMDTDTIGTKDVFNAADSTIYQNNRLALADDLQALYIELENAGAWDMTAFGKLADTEQSKVCQALWAEDGEKKYLLPLINSGSSAYVPMANGKKELQRWNFLTFQRPFISSYFKGSYSVSDVCTIRGYTPSTWSGVEPASTMTITPYYDLWVTVKAGSNVVQQRAGAGEAVTLDLGTSALNDTEIYPYSASMLQDLGDLSCLYPGYCDLAACMRLQKVIIGSSADGYSNTNMTEVSVKNCVMLEEMDVQNCPNLKQALDLTSNIQLRTLKAKGSGITGASFAEYGRLETAEFPAVASIQAKALNFLQSMTLEAWGNLATLVIENCDALDSYAFANSAENLTRVRLIGIEWTVPLSGYDLLMRLHGCGGIDDDGYNTTNGVLTGSVHFTQLTASKLASLKKSIPELTYTYDEMLDEYTCTYKNEDGTILYETKVENGGTAPDPVRLGYIDTPTKASDTELVYTYWKWDNDLSNITADTIFTATFTSSTRYYTVVYCDKSGNALETHTVAAHGSCKYTGDDLPSDDYIWVGWLTETDDVTADLTVMPEYIYPTLPVSVLDLTNYTYAYSDDPDDYEDGSAAYTKAEFAAILLSGIPDTYLAVGDKVNMVPDTTVIADTSIVFSLHGFKHFKVAGSSDFAGTTWFMIGVLNATRQMNTTNTNSGGWPATALRKWLNETLYPAMSPFWRALIKKVIVMSSAGGTSSDIVSSEDYLYLMSRAEVGFNTADVPYVNEVDADAESATFACYTDNNSRIKKMYNGTGSAQNVWLRSPEATGSSSFASINYNGHSYYNNAYTAYGVCIGFSV